MKLRVLLLAAAPIFVLSLSCVEAPAQQNAPRVVTTCGAMSPFNSQNVGTNGVQTVDATGKLCSAASVSASITGFTPATTGTPISVTTGGVTGTLPVGAVVVASNVGTSNIAYCKLGASATTSDQPITPNGGWFAFTVGAATQLTCITSTSTTTVNMVGGAGLPTGTGGGGGGSSGGGDVNITQIAGTAVTAGTGAVGAGSMRVAVARDNTTLAGAAIGTAGTSSADVVTVQGRASMTPVQVSQATASNLNAAVVGTGTAGTPAGGVLTVQGVTSMTKLLVTPDLPSGAATAANQTSVQAVVGAATAPTNMNVVGCVYNSSPITLTNGQSSACQASAAGNTKVEGVGVAQGSTSASQTLSPIGVRTLAAAPTDTTAQTNMPVADINGNQRVSPSASTWGGATKYTLTAANSTNATNVKASAGSLYHIAVYNNSATLAWVSFYNTAGTPTCGTAIVYQTMIPANSTSGAGAVEDFAIPMDFSTGIGICVATGIAGTGSVAASAYVIGLTYK